MQALGLRLTKEDIAEVETGYDFDIGYPNNISNMAGDHVPKGPQDLTMLKVGGYIDYVAPLAPIKPHQGGLDAVWAAE